MTSQRLQQGIKQRLAHDIRSQNISLCWVNNCYDNNPQEDSLTVGELIVRFSKPDLLRGERRLGLADYLALDKTIPEEKERRDAEKNGQGFIPARFKQRGTKLARDVARYWAKSCCPAFSWRLGKGSRWALSCKSTVGLTTCGCAAASTFIVRPFHTNYRFIPRDSGDASLSN
jgi:hypothetical protein